MQLLNELKLKNSEYVKTIQSNSKQIEELNMSIESQKEQLKLISKETDQIIDTRKKLTKLEIANTNMEKSISELSSEKNDLINQNRKMSEESQRMERDLTELSRFKTAYPKLESENIELNRRIRILEEMKNGTVSQLGSNEIKKETIDNAPIVNSPRTEDTNTITTLPPIESTSKPPPAEPPINIQTAPIPPGPPIGIRGPPGPPPLGPRGGPPGPPGPPPLGQLGPKIIWEGPKPIVTMKPFNWDRMIPTKIVNTIFSEIKLNEVTIYDDDQHILQELFCEVKHVKIEKEENKDKDSEKKKKPDKKKSIIDNKKVTNVSIFLVAFKKSDEDIKNAIYMLDKDILNSENLNKLMDNLPDEEDIKTITRYLEESKDTIDKLERPEQFLYTVSQIPHFKKRLETFQYVANFDQKISELDDNLTLVKNATMDIKQNGNNFNKLIQIVWGFGNYINSGTNKGNAPGFQLRSLLRLKETKSSESKYTLLHHIVKHVEAYHKEVLDWVNDFNSSKYASKVSLQSIKDDVVELEKGLDDSEKKIPEVGHSSYKYDVFDSRMPDQIIKCREKFEDFKEKIKILDTDFAEIIILYGLTPQTKPEELFSLIDSFMNDFNDAKKG